MDGVYKGIKVFHDMCTPGCVTTLLAVGAKHKCSRQKVFKLCDLYHSQVLHKRKSCDHAHYFLKCIFKITLKKSRNIIKTEKKSWNLNPLWEWKLRFTKQIFSESQISSFLNVIFHLLHIHNHFNKDVKMLKRPKTQFASKWFFKEPGSVREQGAQQVSKAACGTVTQ